MIADQAALRLFPALSLAGIAKLSQEQMQQFSGRLGTSTVSKPSWLGPKDMGGQPDYAKTLLVILCP
jgi:hypothetical protein